MLAADVAHLEESLAGEEASVRRLEGALKETTQQHGEEATAMTALVEEHAARQRRCRTWIQEEHGPLAALAAAKLRADHAAGAARGSRRSTEPSRRAWRQRRRRGERKAGQGLPAFAANKYS